MHIAPRRVGQPGTPTPINPLGLDGRPYLKPHRCQLPHHPFLPLPLPLSFSVSVSVSFPLSLYLTVPRRTGGQCVYVTLACGELIGAHNTWWVWFSTAVDAAIYPQYIRDSLRLEFGGDISEDVYTLIPTMVIVFVTMINIAGVVRLNAILQYFYIFEDSLFLPPLPMGAFGALLLINVFDRCAYFRTELVLG